MTGQLAAQTDAGQDTRPNILVFLSDHMGWGQPGFNDGTDVPTPGMNRLANEGVKLTQFCVQPVCSPTHASLLTGRYLWKNGMEVRPNTKVRNGMLLDERTISQARSDASYATYLGQQRSCRAAKDDGRGDGVAKRWNAVLLGS